MEFLEQLLVDGCVQNDHVGRDENKGAVEALDVVMADWNEWKLHFQVIIIGARLVACVPVCYMLCLRPLLVTVHEEMLTSFLKFL